MVMAPPRPHRQEHERPPFEEPRRFDWPRFLLGWCVLFHAATALTLATAPWHQLLTQGTAPVFELASRYVWAAAFAAAAALSGALLHRPRPVLQALTWLTVMFLGGVWLTAFSLAVWDGAGSALGVVVWPFLYGPWAVVAMRLGLGRR